MVVFYHYVGVPNADIGHRGHTKILAWGTSAANIFPNFLHQPAMYGWTGVELFFMISGFVICMSGWGRKPADFFVSRVVRIVPGYWAATALTAIVLWAFPRMTNGIKPSMILTNLTMVQSAYGVPNLVPAYWTLFVELTFYLLFGLVAIGGITYRRMVTFCVLWSVASLAAATSHDAVLNMIINPPYSPFFIAGIAFFLIHKFGSNLLLWAIVAYSWLISVNQPHRSPPWQVVVILTAFFVVMALVATHRLDRVRWPWLTVAGALTYPLYLIHQDIGFTVFTYLRGDIPATALVALTFAGVLALSWLIHVAVERPVAPLLRAKLTEAVGRVRTSGPQLASAMAGSGAAGSAPAGSGAAGSATAGTGAGATGTAGPQGVVRCASAPRHRTNLLHPRSRMAPPSPRRAAAPTSNGTVTPNGTVTSNGAVASNGAVTSHGTAAANGTVASNGTPASNGTAAPATNEPAAPSVNGTNGHSRPAAPDAPSVPAADEAAVSRPGAVSQRSGSPR
jgi:peptidoglycan/LPS O-acetylase OafA/YrhL